MPPPPPPSPRVGCYAARKILKRDANDRELSQRIKLSSSTFWIGLVILSRFKLKITIRRPSGVTSNNVIYDIIHHLCCARKIWTVHHCVDTPRSRRRRKIEYFKWNTATPWLRKLRPRRIRRLTERYPSARVIHCFRSQFLYTVTVIVIFFSPHW